MQVTVRQDRGQVHFAAAAAGFGRPRHAHIPRWHFDMVLDTRRNAAYQAAIQRAIELKRAAGDEAIYVLDMGAGSGILSLMAARLGRSPSGPARISPHADTTQGIPSLMAVTCLSCMPHQAQLA